MTAPPLSQPRPSAGELQALRDAVARVASERGPVLPFGVGPLDHLLAGGGLDGAGLHEVAAASASWSDDAAATLDRKSTRLNSSHSCACRMPSSACKQEGVKE